LHLIQNRALGKTRQKALGVLLGKIPFVGIFQRNIGFVGKAGAGQRRLAGLARPGQGQHRKASGQTFQRSTGLAWIHKHLVSCKSKVLTLICKASRNILECSDNTLQFIHSQKASHQGPRIIFQKSGGF
jgi:hypothetical protein